MAYIRSTRIDPRDLQKNTAIGVKIPFNTSGVFSSTFSTKEQIKYNVINLLLTSKGERIENPRFGTNLRSQLFEQLTETTIDNIKEGIIDSIHTYIPEVKVENIEILQDPNYNTNTIVVEVTYKILISGQTDSITVNFE